MNQSKTGWFTCLVGILSMVCLAAAATGGVFVFIPLQAEKHFGPAASSLNPIQHLYLSTFLLMDSRDLVRPVDIAAADQVFSIDMGEPTKSIVSRLKNQGLIRDPQVMLNYLVYAGLDTTIQAGTYRLNPAMSALQIARKLQDPTPSEVDFRILPGWRAEEIAAALPTSGLAIRPTDFLNAVALPPSDYPFLEELPELASLEGYLFPDSYQPGRETNVNELIALILANFDRQVDQELRQGFSQQGLTLHQAITLASIVEREAVIDEEMPVIASVFLNRLAVGMKLDSDPTVQYALGYNPEQDTWWTNPLSKKDLQVNSPYNTYLNPGLPPGPISNPGLAALKAIAYPANTDYYYFRAACDGSGRHLFSQTYEQHLQKSCP
jgi:UPF0755 protein